MAKNEFYLSGSFKELNKGVNSQGLIFNNGYISEVNIEKHVQTYLSICNSLKKKIIKEEDLQKEATLIVDYWIAATKQITDVANEEMGLNVISSLNALSKLPQSSKSFCALCLVLLMKQEKFKKVQSLAYSSVPEICTTSNLFLLFLQINKIFAKAHNTSGWGRGLRRAACNWYLRRDPKKLALEVSRHPGAYSWKHKDILKLVHFNNEKLPTGTLLVIRYILNGFERTQKDYHSKENASQILSILNILHIGKNEACDAKKMIERSKKIHKEFGSVMLEDLPSAIHKESKVMEYILDVGNAPLIIPAFIQTQLFDHCCSTAASTAKLVRILASQVFCSAVDPVDLLIAYNVCRRKAIGKSDARESGPSKWMNYAPPAEDKLLRINALKAIDDNSKKIIETLTQLIVKCTENCKETKKSACVFIDNTLNMKSYIDISDGNTGAKEITALQAASLTLFYLASNSRFDVITPYVPTPSGYVSLENLPKPCPLHLVKTKFKKFEMSSSFTSLMLEESLRVARMSSKDTCIFLCFQVSRQIYDAVRVAIDIDRMKNPQHIVRVIICGMQFPEDPSQIVLSSRPDIVIIPGFSRCALPTIRDLHEFQAS